jgi:hypothetical protein
MKGMCLRAGNYQLDMMEREEENLKRKIKDRKNGPLDS